jgi:hypothetical protein
MVLARSAAPASGFVAAYFCSLFIYENSVTKYMELSNVQYHRFSFFITLPHIRFVNNFGPELFPVSQKTSPTSNMLPVSSPQGIDFRKLVV